MRRAPAAGVRRSPQTPATQQATAAFAHTAALGLRLPRRLSAASCWPVGCSAIGLRSRRRAAAQYAYASVNTGAGVRAAAAGDGPDTPPMASGSGERLQMEGGAGDAQPAMDIRHALVPASQGARLSEFVAGLLGGDRPRAEWLVRFGAVWCRPPSAKRIERWTEDAALPPETYVRVSAAPKRFPVGEVDWRARLLHEEEDFAVLDKPSGIPTHCTTDNLHENCAAEVGRLLGLGGAALVTTRLDQPTGGLLVLGKRPAFVPLFNEAARLGVVQKRYRARVRAGGPGPPLGPMLHYMLKSERAPKVVRKEPGAEGAWQECLLTVLGVEGAGPGELALEIELGTGRSHQIRAQLAAAGYPIVGDAVYGAGLDAGAGEGPRPAPAHRWSAGSGAGFGLSCSALEWPRDLPAALARARARRAAGEGPPAPAPPDEPRYSFFLPM
eukprot:tig00000903_g5521.t1